MLKSGGPVMTIDNVSSNTGGLKCVWFTADGHLQESWFAGAAVVEATVPSPTKKKKD